MEDFIGIYWLKWRFLYGLSLYLTIGMMAGRPLLAKITLQLDGF
jgi:hypothetical protein